jgi:RNA polymerase-associated protein
LDERYPHPPLMSVDPISKARSRQQLRQIETEWYPLVETIVRNENADDVKRARRDLTERLIQMIPVFAHKPFFMSDEYTVVDITLSVIFWRINSFGIDLPKTNKGLYEYAKRMYERESFRDSLTDLELELGDF